MVVEQHVASQYLKAVRLQEDVVEDAMEAPYVVGVGGVSAGAEQRGEGRAQLHGEGLLWTTGDPVWVGVWHQTALDQLADTWEGVV